MPLSNLLILCGVGGAAAVLLLFPEFRKKLGVLLGGFLNLFVEDTAKTPEGAAAIYSKAIEEAEDKYNKASDALKRMTGRLETAIKARDKANREVQEYESKARTAKSRGDEATARVYAEKRQDSILVAKQYADTVNQLTPAVAQARDIFTQREKELKDIRAKKNLVVEQLKTNRDVEAAYDDLDELRRDSASKRLLGAIDEEVKAGSERAAGSRIVHEAKLNTRVARADEKSDDYAVNDFLDSLRSPASLPSSTKRPTIEFVTPKQKEKH